MTLPRIIWIYWAQGWDAAPELSQRARRAWTLHNPDWDVRAIDAGGVQQLLGQDWPLTPLPDTITQTAKSDLVRLALLKSFGGVWVDATTFPVQPLDTWIEPHTATGSFAFDKPGPNRPIATWFIAAYAGNRLLQKWHDRAWEYWRGRDEMDHYHWVHNLFDLMLKEDPEARALFEQIQPISAAHPLHFGPQHPALAQSVSEAFKAAIRDEIAPRVQANKPASFCSGRQHNGLDKRKTIKLLGRS